MTIVFPRSNFCYAVKSILSYDRVPYCRCQYFGRAPLIGTSVRSDRAGWRNRQYDIFRNTFTNITYIVKFFQKSTRSTVRVLTRTSRMANYSASRKDLRILKSNKKAFPSLLPDTFIQKTSKSELFVYMSQICWQDNVSIADYCTEHSGITWI